MTKQHAMKWVNALRSGDYKQGKCFLHNFNKNTYCCLGVLDAIFPKMNLKGESRYILKNYSIIRLNTSIGVFGETSLAALNDNLDFTFDEIADVIQAEYVERVMV